MFGNRVQSVKNLLNVKIEDDRFIISFNSCDPKLESGHSTFSLALANFVLVVSQNIPKVLEKLVYIDAERALQLSASPAQTCELYLEAKAAWPKGAVQLIWT